MDKWENNSNISVWRVVKLNSIPSIFLISEANNTMEAEEIHPYPSHNNIQKQNNRL